jgi:hypothetical protein
VSAKKEKAARKESPKAATAPPVRIHGIKKFMGGRMTPEEIHAQLGVGKPCKGCQRPALIVIRSLCTLKDWKDKVSAGFQQLVGALTPDGHPPTFPTKYGPMICIGELFVCKSCAPAAERVAAKHPDWILIEINRGPKPLPIQSGYGAPSSVRH